MSGPLLVALLLLVCVALVGCGKTKEETIVIEPEYPIESWREQEHLPAAALPGARVFAASGCLACHTYLGSGSRNLGAHDLSAIGRRHRVRFFERFVAKPERYGNAVMPPFGALGLRKLHRLALFLAASKGAR